MPRQRRILNALVMALAWTAVLLGGADWPPPPGFAWAALLALAAGVMTYARSPTYAAWAKARLSRGDTCASCWKAWEQASSAPA